MDIDPGFRYLNLENRWPGCDYASHGLSLGADGALRLAEELTGYRRTGGLLIGPIVASDRPTEWQLLRANVPLLPANAHVRFFTLTSAIWDASSTGTGPSPPWDAATSFVTPQTNDSLPTPLETWHALPLDSLDGRIFNAPGRFLWVAGILQGDGDTTPVLDQIRIDFDQSGWLPLLPEIYQRDESHSTIDQMLRLFEQSLGRSSNLIDDLAASCSPWSALDDGLDSWLDWLAGWLGVELDETWAESQRRRTVARAFRTHAKRGTAESLQNYLAQCGLRARVEEAGPG
jgi:phage tail-like protein